MGTPNEESDLLARLMSEAIRDHNHQMATVFAQIDTLAERINFLEYRLAEIRGLSLLCMVPTPHSC
jgi:hypothetical protein